MSKRGQQSRAHEYDNTGACIHCGMHLTNVEKMSHECTSWREALIDAEEDSRGEQHSN